MSVIQMHYLKQTSNPRLPKLYYFVEERLFVEAASARNVRNPRLVGLLENAVVLPHVLRARPGGDRTPRFQQDIGRRECVRRAVLLAQRHRTLEQAHEFDTWKGEMIAAHWRARPNSRVELPGLVLEIGEVLLLGGIAFKDAGVRQRYRF